MPARRCRAICRIPANAIAGAPLSHPARDDVQGLVLAAARRVVPGDEGRRAVLRLRALLPDAAARRRCSRTPTTDVLATLPGRRHRPTACSGNPDVKPEKTVQYQFGYKQAINDGPGARRQRLLQGHPRSARRRVHLRPTTAPSTRASRTPTSATCIGLHDRASTSGRSGLFEHARSTTPGSARRATPAIRARRRPARRPARIRGPRQSPFNWDQRHTVNLTRDARAAGATTPSAPSCASASGQPYTPALEARLRLRAGGRTPGASRRRFSSTCAAREDRHWRRLTRRRCSRASSTSSTRATSTASCSRARAARTTRAIADRPTDSSRSRTRRRYYAPRRDRSRASRCVSGPDGEARAGPS